MLILYAVFKQNSYYNRSISSLAVKVPYNLCFGCFHQVVLRAIKGLIKLTPLAPGYGVVNFDVFPFR